MPTWTVVIHTSTVKFHYGNITFHKIATDISPVGGKAFNLKPYLKSEI